MTPEPLTDAELEAWAAEHFQSEDGHCWICNISAWPCTASRLIAEVKRLRREWYDKRELLAHAGLALSRAAELLDCTGECEEDSPCPPCLVYADAMAAIAAIREGR